MRQPNSVRNGAASGIAPFTLAAALILIKICELDGFEDVDLPWLLKYSNSDSGAQPNLF